MCRGTVKREDTGEEIPVHIVPFSSEESEAEYYGRMEEATEEERKEVLSWEPVFLMD